MSGKRSLRNANWKRINALLEVALELPEIDRDSWLNALALEHAHEKALIQRLIDRADLISERFMARPVGTDLLNEASEALDGDQARDFAGPFGH
jgi:hypothetical protein